eukprot:4662594-Amphidinium_carterae.1
MEADDAYDENAKLDEDELEVAGDEDAIQDDEPQVPPVEVKRERNLAVLKQRGLRQSTAAVRDVAAKAICQIKYHIRRHDGLQFSAVDSALDNWEYEFKPVLGSLKRFVLSRADQFLVLQQA